jgi:hypothetical protein
MCAYAHMLAHTHSRAHARARTRTLTGTLTRTRTRVRAHSHTHAPAHARTLKPFNRAAGGNKPEAETIEDSYSCSIFQRRVFGSSKGWAKWAMSRTSCAKQMQLKGSWSCEKIPAKKQLMQLFAVLECVFWPGQLKHRYNNNILIAYQ